MRLKYYIEEFAKIARLKQYTTERFSHKNLGYLWQLCLFFRNPELETITPDDIIDFYNAQMDLGYKRNGVAMRAARVRAFWKWMNKKGVPTFSHEAIPVIPKEWTSARVATEAEYKTLLDFLPSNFHGMRDKALIMMLWDTGARNGEIASLNLKDIDTERMKAIIRTEKSRGVKPAREIYWTEETNKAICTWLDAHNEYTSTRFCTDPEALFFGSSRHGIGARLKVVGISQILRVWSMKAHIPILNPHSFRHHMGHDLAGKGANNAIISSILGHSNLQSSFKYTDLNDLEREQAYNKLKRQ